MRGDAVQTNITEKYSMSPQSSNASSEREGSMNQSKDQSKSAKENASEIEGISSHLEVSQSRADASDATNTQGTTVHSHSEAPPAQLKDDGEVSAYHPSSSGGHSTGDEDEEDEIRDQQSDGQPLDNESKLKREKRLAMNRASARERRRRKRVHTEELEQRVIQLSRQSVALQQRNESLQLYVVKLERDLANANAAISVLRKGEGVMSRVPLPPALSHSSLLPPPPPPPLPPRAGAFASTVQEQERIRSLLGIVQQQQQDNLVASRAASWPNHLLGGHSIDPHVLDLLQRQQRPPSEGIDGLASLVAGRGGGGGPPLDSSEASHIPHSSGRAGGANENPALSLLTSLQRRNPPPRTVCLFILC